MRVVSWNVWWRFGEPERRREVVLAELRRLGPDVVGLQEVWASAEVPGDDLASWLGAELGMHHVLALAGSSAHWRDRLGGAPYDVGNAVLSRWPVVEHEVLGFPEGRGGALYARLDAPGHAVPFFTCHLDADPAGSAVRCGQVARLAGFVAERRGGTAYPPVLTGDYNALPDSDEMRLLGGYRTAPAVAGQVLLDAWEFAAPGVPWATWDAANPHVARAFPLDARVDYVHVGVAGGGSELGRVRWVGRAGDGPVAGVWPSDHAAVTADLV